MIEEKEIIKYKTKLKKICEKIDFIAGVLMGILSIVVIAEVFFRYAMNRPFSMTFDLVMLLFPWMFYLAFVSVTYNDEHIKMVFAIMKLPKKIKKIVISINKILEMIFFIILLIGSIQLSITVKDHLIKMGELYVSKAFFYMSIVFSFAMILYLKCSELYYNVLSNYTKTKEVRRSHKI